jgi:16S rRNA (guanine(966)-N(2))-methyltransferase RsmD
VRVIAGTAKGTRLGPVPSGTRPVSDRAREGLFSSLGDVVLEARVLDLFAGSGALGIEALSRGARHALFADHSRQARDAIRQNLQRAQLDGRATVVRSDIVTLLRKGNADQDRFDLVFCDPPYDLEGPQLEDALQELASGWLRESNWTVVLTRASQSSTPVIPLHWLARRRLRYGDSLLIVYQEDSWA